MEFPKCERHDGKGGRCNGKDWKFIEHREDRGVTIDIYECQVCAFRPPPWRMTWAYTDPEKALK